MLRGGGSPTQSWSRRRRWRGDGFEEGVCFLLSFRSERGPRAHGQRSASSAHPRLCLEPWRALVSFGLFLDPIKFFLYWVGWILLDCVLWIPLSFYFGRREVEGGEHVSVVFGATLRHGTGAGQGPEWWGRCRRGGFALGSGVCGNPAEPRSPPERKPEWGGVGGRGGKGG